MLQTLPFQRALARLKQDVWSRAMQRAQEQGHYGTHWVERPEFNLLAFALHTWQQHTLSTQAYDPFTAE